MVMVQLSSAALSGLLTVMGVVGLRVRGLEDVLSASLISAISLLQILFMTC